MSEFITQTAERKLRYEGPNYTADAVIIDYDAAKVLLIERKDTGDKATPGGFMDPSDTSSSQAAVREVEEETGVVLSGDAPLIFRGRVDDPRSSATSWIETSAHLFNIPFTTSTQAGDDAKTAAWYDIDSLPPLYGSHLQLIERALDYLEGQQLFSILESPDAQAPVEGGFMKYDKRIFEKDGRMAFIKQRPIEHDISPDRYEEMYQYLEKEAGIMAHLRQNGFKHLPEKSALKGETLIMDAIRPQDGWHWEADPATVDAYLQDTLTAFADLETMPLPNDTFKVEPSYESIIQEGWDVFNQDTYDLLMAKYPDFANSLTQDQQVSAEKLVSDIPSLKELVSTAPAPDKFVLCHHDIRQSNLAWHPEQGVKIIDWSWAGAGLPGTDSTGLLIDLHKNGYDVSKYYSHLSPEHCLNLLGFWLRRSTLPSQGAEGLREQQFISALSAYELFCKTLEAKID